jgi:hypothetical protein
MKPEADDHIQGKRPPRAEATCNCKVCKGEHPGPETCPECPVCRKYGPGKHYPVFEMPGRCTKCWCTAAHDGTSYEKMDERHDKIEVQEPAKAREFNLEADIDTYLGAAPEVPEKAPDGSKDDS